VPSLNKTQFVIGFPKNLSERQQARGVIKANASRHRWAGRGTTADENGRPRRRRRPLPPNLTPYDTYVAHKDAATQPYARKLLEDHLDEEKDAGSIKFSQSLEKQTLSPVFLLDRPSTVSENQLWKFLDTSKLLRRQILPVVWLYLT
jgi:hypothetical protein